MHIHDNIAAMQATTIAAITPGFNSPSLRFLYKLLSCSVLFIEWSFKIPSIIVDGLILSLLSLLPLLPLLPLLSLSISSLSKGVVLFGSGILVSGIWFVLLGIEDDIVGILYLSFAELLVGVITKVVFWLKVVVGIIFNKFVGIVVWISAWKVVGIFFGILVGIVVGIFAIFVGIVVSVIFGIVVVIIVVIIVDKIDNVVCVVVGWIVGKTVWFLVGTVAWVIGVSDFNGKFEFSRGNVLSLWLDISLNDSFWLLEIW